MANPSVTYLTGSAATDANNDTNITSGSVTPTANALLCAAYAGNGGHTISSFSTTLNTTGSWYGPYTVDQGTQTVAIGFIKLTASPGTGTVSATLSSKTNRKAIHLSQATGYDTTTPLLNTTSNTATGSSTTPSVTLTGVDTGNTTFGATCAANSPAPNQGVELYENGGAAGIPYLASMADTTSPGNTVSWTMTSSAWAVAAVEIKAEAGATTHQSDVNCYAATDLNGRAFSTAFSNGRMEALSDELAFGYSIAFSTGDLRQSGSLSAEGIRIAVGSMNLSAIGSILGTGNVLIPPTIYLPLFHRRIPRRRRLYP